ncbi:Aste57867_9769 [Aphanomyces stellatus]|uniref:Aste57867_9769 protein n=1 Tax=Aphanomyces stellatus TaxID=120398 RepID=A0A485KNQ5_9STRA|nr:hypothetical protein As57867_009730 [Aphanomyces stellatus]VFT86648.1 Aste57867_9769 [Aphanomyces stellatus]
MKISTFCFLALAALVATSTVSGPHLQRSVDGIFRTPEQIAAINNDADTNRKCHQSNGNYISSLKAGNYAASKFHNCFRTTQQIFEFVDTLTSQNTNLISKFPISTTVKGQTIYAYKLSTGAKPKALYYESLIHAREWIAGSSLIFALSSFLDDIANNQPGPHDLFDIIFVPIVNIDGYDITWNNNRMQRKNANEVYLNRNFPSFYTNPRPPK